MIKSTHINFINTGEIRVIQYSLKSPGENPPGQENTISQNQGIGQPSSVLKVRAHHHEAGMK